MIIKLPIKTVSEANGHKKAIKRNGKTVYKNEHWSETAKRHRMQKEAIRFGLANRLNIEELPTKIKLTRIAPRKLDFRDNINMSFKWIIDAIFEIYFPGKAIGRADDNISIQVEFDQKKGGVGEYAIEIEIIHTQNQV